MPRPAPNTITFTIDGLEVKAPENSMLVDAAKHGDVEIPVFCYEPKLGNPVGACRMCLVEIEGIPKLQTGCSTPVKDGMVVHTQSERVKEAQNSVVEFLLVNHPLDCPVCDKGGECPLQDITFGWGRGTSRFIEPKRHFVKPLALSPNIAIDRERCILCYRCVRFSQEISEDHQLVLQERGAHSYVSTFDGHPYVAPFSGNIVELCPVGALTSQPYRFRARPWDIEDSGTVCTLCPAQCNVTLTVRDERVLRVLSREHPEVDDGWLCDRGRFAYPALGGTPAANRAGAANGAGAGKGAGAGSGVGAANGAEAGKGVGAGSGAGAGSGVGAANGAEAGKGVGAGSGAGAGKGVGAGSGVGAGKGSIDPGARVTQPLLRDGGELRPVSWERALAEAAAGLSRAGERTGAVVGGEATNEEGHLLARLMREGLGSPHIDSRRAGTLALELHRALGDPRLQARVSDLEFAHAVLVLAADPIRDAPILDLRLRKGVRRHGMKLLRASAADLLDDKRVGELTQRLREAGEETVVLWHERLTAGPDGAAAARALLDLAQTLSLADTDGAGLLEIPAGTNGRGLREAGVLPNAGPGLRELGSSGGAEPLDARGIAEGLTAGGLAAVVLLQTDPLSTDETPLDRNPAGGDPPAHAIPARYPDAADLELWEQALEHASTVVAHAAFLTDGLRAHANVVLPAQAYAEKEGTVVHPDGRIQRLRPAVAHPGSTRAQWQVLADLAARIGLDLEVRTGSMASQQLFDAVPFYAGLTLEEIGGKGVRWQERDAAGAYPGGVHA